jgi:hypothetical protein
MTNAQPNSPCACPGCSLNYAADDVIERDGKRYCSQACADFHPAGKPCPCSDCHCEHSMALGDRSISDSKLDEAIEETFPASDPISP